jgi:serine/threonine-protein kinase
MPIEKLQAEAHARVGKTLSEKYTLDALIGFGGMAAVYAATHRNGSRAALKVLHAQLTRVGDVRTRFIREGYVANKVAHPGVVRVLDDDTSADGSVYLVMELLEGQTLERRRAAGHGKLPVAEAVGHVARILEILEAAHAQAIVHRDIKPDNVFLQLDGTLKLMDFGIARLLDGSSATRTGALMGTPAYMPPEQAGGRPKEIDERSDIWATGALLFVLLTGEEVHKSRTEQEQLIYAATQPARLVRTASAQVPAELAEVVDVALAYDRAQRWQAASAMRTALLSAAASAGIAVEQGRPRLDEARPRLEVVRPSSPPEAAPALPPAHPTLIMGSTRRETPPKE